MFNRLKRQFARGTLGLVFSAHFMRRRALSTLNRHFRKGELVLRYKMKDHTLYLDPADDVIAARVLLRGEWQRRDLMRVVSLLKAHRPELAGKLFIDVGSNIGTETVYAMLSGFFTGGVAIEPEPHNFSLLQENVSANDLQGKIRTLQCAVGAAAGKGHLLRTKWNYGGHALAETGTEGLAVAVLPLSDIVVDAGAAGLIWMDVNGTEASVLKGMDDILRARVPIVIEHLPSFITEAAAREIHSIMAAHYSFYCRVDDVDEDPKTVDKMNPLRDAGDFLFF